MRIASASATASRPRERGSARQRDSDRCFRRATIGSGEGPHIAVEQIRQVADGKVDSGRYSQR